MSNDNLSRIIVGKIPVGILGLKEVLENLAPKYRDRADSEIIEVLLSEIGKRNYIASNSRKEYGEALLKEFKKYLGEPVKDEVPAGIHIKVLGPGCPQCDSLEQELMEVMTETGIVAELEHVRDPKEIGEYGVMGTPALVINGKVISIGMVPPRLKLIQWLKEEITAQLNKMGVK